MIFLFVHNCIIKSYTNTTYLHILYTRTKTYIYLYSNQNTLKAKFIIKIYVSINQINLAKPLVKIVTLKVSWPHWTMTKFWHLIGGKVIHRYHRRTSSSTPGRHSSSSSSSPSSSSTSGPVERGTLLSWDTTWLSVGHGAGVVVLITSHVLELYHVSQSPSLTATLVVPGALRWKLLTP